MGVSDESAILAKWLVREGDRIHRGQPVFSLETDKATFQYEAESDGYLVRILTGEGEEAAVGSPVGILSDAGSDVNGSELETFLKETVEANEKAHGPNETANHSTDEKISEPLMNRLPDQTEAEQARRISPRARKKANTLGVNLNAVRTGSGPEGRILERDVLNYVQASMTDSRHERKTSGIRAGRPLTQDDRVNARPVSAEGAGQTGFVSRLIDARKIPALCATHNGIAPGTVICCELAKLLAETPELNARHHGDRIYEYNTVHLRVTVETSSGTLKPVIRCAETYSPDELDVLIRNAAGRCRRFSSKPQEFLEGTFTVADLSAYGTDCFTPELTPPELCTLGIGAVTMQTEINGQGGIDVYPAIRLTLVFDRAGTDALHAAEFLNRLAIRLEPGGTRQSIKHNQPHI